MPDKVNLDNISIVLNKPRHPENIGAAARAICNMGIGRLVVVDPQNYDPHRASRMATHAASHVIEGMEIFDDLETALGSYRYIAGTTARLGGQRQAVTSPRTFAEGLIPIARENPVAIVFGPEDRGLANEDIRYCHVLINIPTDDFSSLNLAQAVMIVCHEIFSASLEGPSTFAPRLATRDELEKMYAQLSEILVRISFINPENPDHWINGLRRFLNRLPLRTREVNIIRGVCRQINWYGTKSFEDGTLAQQHTAHDLRKEGK
ncbi:MAG: RNA methyltransferase [Desulfobacterales bacterium]